MEQHQRKEARLQLMTRLSKLSPDCVWPMSALCRKGPSPPSWVANGNRPHLSKMTNQKQRTQIQATQEGSSRAHSPANIHDKLVLHNLRSILGSVSACRCGLKSRWDDDRLMMSTVDFMKAAGDFMRAARVARRLEDLKSKRLQFYEAILWEEYCAWRETATARVIPNSNELASSLLLFPAYIIPSFSFFFPIRNCHRHPFSFFPAYIIPSFSFFFTNQKLPPHSKKPQRMMSAAVVQNCSCVIPFSRQKLPKTVSSSFF